MKKGILLVLLSISTTGSLIAGFYPKDFVSVLVMSTFPYDLVLHIKPE